MKEAEKKYQVITCQPCAGTGLVGADKICNSCLGSGLGIFEEGRYHYWGKRMSFALIQLERLAKYFNITVNFVAYIIGMIGVGALIGWLWMYPIDVWFSGPINGIESIAKNFYFWEYKHQLILLFWISIIVDMFVIFRMDQARKRRATIRHFKLGKKVTPANNWSDVKKTIKRNIAVDASYGYGVEAKNVADNAFLLSLRSDHISLEPVHIFISLLDSNDIIAIFSRLNADFTKIVEKVKGRLQRLPALLTPVEISPDARQVLIEAYIDAYKNGQTEVDPLNLILPCVYHDKELMEILYDIEIDFDTLNNVVAWFRINDKLMRNYRKYKSMARFKPTGNMDRAYTAVATPLLDNFSTDLTYLAKFGRLDLCVSRDKEIMEIFHTWESHKTGIILVGSPGVGKRNIAYGLAEAMAAEDVPKKLRDKRLLELDLPSLVSGVTPSEAQERMITVLNEVAYAGNIVLYIENIENIIGITTGSEQSMELSEVLAGVVEKNHFYILLTTTPDNFTQSLESRQLGRVLAKIDVIEPHTNQAIQILESKIGYLEGKYKVYFTYRAIKRAVELTERYIHDKYLPEKAIDIIEATAARIAGEKGEESIVDSEDVAAQVSHLTNIPLTKVTELESGKLLNLEDEIHKRMIGQTEAVDLVAASLRRARVEIREKKRPIASFLFLGPTGVGKTELAKTVAEVYFGREDCMVRLDMSEYQQPDSVNKMIGSANTTGYLTEAVRKLPFTLILLDEIEKAHPNILNLFLQVMDDGRLTDGTGKTIDFTNCIIIVTSNIGSNFIQEQIRAGSDLENIKQAVINEHLTTVMRPELINRFDGVVVFKPLSIDDVTKVTGLMLGKVRAMLDEKGINFQASETGLAKLAQAGYDPKFGARPLRRLIQDKVENIIARLFLSGQIARRDTIIIDDNGEVQIQKGRAL